MSLEPSDQRPSLAERFVSLGRVGTALMRELDEGRLLHEIAETTCRLTGAQFAAFSLRPTDESGQLVPSEGNLFHLAVVVGVTEEQEALFRQMPLGGEGLLAPIFRHGVSVLVPDILTHVASSQSLSEREVRNKAREAALAYTHGQLSADGLRSVGLPHGHPEFRSFLGAPLLDSEKQVRGGLLLGHSKPDHFTSEDEVVLVGLAAQAAVALENARLYRSIQMRAQEMNAIFEGITEGVTLVDRKGQILRENVIAHQIREQLQGQKDGERKLEALLYEPARLALQDGPARDHSVIINDEHGNTREYLVTASRLLQTLSSSDLSQEKEESGDRKDPIISGVVIVWHDVTERRIREAEYRAHREAEKRLALLQLILDALPGSVYLVRGKDARLVLANRAAKSVWGAEWAQGQTFTDFRERNGIQIFGVDGRLHPSSQLATMRALEGVSVYQHQETIRHPDGTSIPVLVNAIALKAHELYNSASDTLDALVGSSEPIAIVIHQDVTALKEAEQLKDEFIGIAAHELRTPLTILKGFAQTLIVQTARGKGPELADWQVESLQDIDQATTRMVELTEDLLDVTRLQAGRLDLHIEPADLVSLVQRLVSRLQLTTARHRLVIQSVPTHLVVNADPRRMEQILSNLLSNAIKYSLDSGVIQIHVYQDEHAHMAVVSIQDPGIGIPKSQQARIFGRFARAENAQTYGIGGTGLGLYLSRELIERLRGRIWFESSEGEGSTFFIALPLFPDESTADQEI